jgi:DNA-binding NarL/FixJ family response regulator
VSAARTALLERDDELEALRTWVRRLAAGEGRAVVIEGPAGIGKTALMLAATDGARHAGARVLRARGGELEREDQFGVVQQLFGAPLSVPELGELPESAAAALGRGDAAAAPPGEEVARAAHHALFELCVRLSDPQPLLLTIDDAHWADERSLRWLLFLARRLDRAPIALVIARRPSEPGSEDTLLDRIATLEGTILLSPSPLSDAATGELVRDAMGAGADPEFCVACRRATAGNPFLLRELVAELRESGVAPTADAASLALSVGPESVARSTLLRLARAPQAALALARALAVLEEAPLRDVAALAGVDPPAAAEAAGALEAARLMEAGTRLRFTHPLVRSAIYRELDEPQRARAHGTAARVLAGSGASPERIAAHLMLAAPDGDDEASRALQAAARRAYSSGAPDAAAAYLRRALAEPPSRALRAEVLFELGRAEVRAGEPNAEASLEAAAAIAGGGAQSARVLRELSRAYMRSGRMAKATDTFEAAVDSAGEDRELLLSLEGELAATLANVTSAADAARRLARFSDLPGDTSAERSVLAVLAFASVQGNHPARVAAGMLDRVLAGGDFVHEQTAATVVFADAIFALMMSDGERRALQTLETALADARRLGWTIGISAAPFYQAWAQLRLGHLGAAIRHAEASLAVSDERGWQAFTTMAGAVLCEAQLERGEIDAASAALARGGLPDEVPASALFQLGLYARGLLRAQRGDNRGALEDLLLCGEREIALGGVTPAAMAWRSHAALAYARLGEVQRARELAREELALARELESPRAIGISLQALAVVEGGARELPALEEAVAVLSDCDARLELARALCALGAAVRRSNRRVDARAPLREALSQALALEAGPLAERAREELLAAGGRPRRNALRGADALTASEQRVTRMAAAGRSNRDIAAELVVSVRTVEFHLTRAYGKLGISSREQLVDALGADASSGD